MGEEQRSGRDTDIHCVRVCLRRRQVRCDKIIAGGQKEAGVGRGNTRAETRWTERQHVKETRSSSGSGGIEIRSSVKGIDY